MAQTRGAPGERRGVLNRLSQKGDWLRVFEVPVAFL
jgi:hypothetical protein